MALIRRFINCEITVRRPERRGPGGDISVDTILASGVEAIYVPRMERFHAAESIDDAANVRFLVDIDDALAKDIREGDLIDWVGRRKGSRSGTGAEVRETIMHEWETGNWSHLEVLARGA